MRTFHSYPKNYQNSTLILTKERLNRYKSTVRQETTCLTIIVNAKPWKTQINHVIVPLAFYGVAFSVFLRQVSSENCGNIRNVCLSPWAQIQYFSNYIHHLFLSHFSGWRGLEIPITFFFSIVRRKEISLGKISASLKMWIRNTERFEQYNISIELIWRYQLVHIL